MTVRKRTGLDKKVIGLKAGQVGLDTGSNPQLVDQSWLKVENARWTKKGAITKRFGMDKLPAAYQEPHAAVYKGDLVVLDRGLKAFEGAAWASGVMRQQDVLALWNIEQSRHTVQQGAIVHQPNTARLEASNLEVRTSLEVNEIVSPVTRQSYIRSYDTQSGRLIQQADITAASAFHTRLIVDANSSTIWCFYVESAGGATVRYRSISAAGVISAEFNTGLAAAPNFQLDIIQVQSTPRRIFMGIIRDANNASVRILSINVDTHTYASATNAAANVGAVGCWTQDSGGLFIGSFYDRATLMLMIVGYNQALTQVFAPMQVGHLPTFGVGEEAVNICGLPYGNAAGRLWYTWYDGGTLKPRVFINPIDFTLPIAPVSLGTSRIHGKAQIISKPWVDRNGLFLGVTQPDALDYYVISGADGSLVGKSLIFGSGTNNGTNDWFISDTFTLATGRYLTTAKRILDADADTIAGVGLEIIDPDRVLSLETSDALVIGGSLPQYWAGKVPSVGATSDTGVVELGYCLRLPETPTGVAAVHGGGSVDVGGHFYVITYQWYDAKNLLHESAPSQQVNISVLAPNDSVVLTCPCLHNTNKLNVRIAIYRTEAASVATTTMYLAGTRTNSRSTDTVPFTDLLPDSVVNDQRTLPTTGGVLPNSQPPPGHIQALHQNRHFLVDEENPGTVIRYTKVMEPGVAPEHSSLLILRIPPEGGNITALSSFYDSLIVFKQDLAYRVTGTGLSAFGLGRGYSEPYLVSEAVGCTQQKSVVVLPGALAFLAPTGLHQMSTKFAVTAMGDPVRHFTDTYAYRSGALLPAQHAAVWVSDAAGAPALVYDYLYDLWSTWTNGQAKDCAVVGGELALVGAGSGAEDVRGQTLESFTDDGISPTTTLESGIFSFAGLASFQRLYSLLVVGYSLDAFKLLVAFQYDNDPAWRDEQTLDTIDLDAFDMSEYYGAGAGSYNEDALIMRAIPYRQRITSFRVRIRDAEQTGQSFTFTGMAAVVGLLNREMRLGPRRSAS